MPRKSRLMLSIEERLGQPLEKALPKMINNAGLAATARHLGISLSTLKYWMLKFDIRLEWIAVRSNERIVSKRAA